MSFCETNNKSMFTLSLSQGFVGWTNKGFAGSIYVSQNAIKVQKD